LVETESDGFIVEVTVYHVPGLSSVGASAAYGKVRCCLNSHV
jgi:hypothetical protein